MIAHTYLRHEAIGSSDAAAIVGKSPYKTAYDVWLEKVQMVEGGIASNEACDLGSMCESGLLDWAQTQLALRGMQRDVSMRDETHQFIAANLDAIGELPDATHANIEAKTAGLASPLQWERWGDEFADEIPEEYIIQVHHQMYVAKLDRTYLPALLAPRGRKMYIIHRSEPLIQFLLAAEVRFWNKHVLTRIPPSNVRPSEDVIRRVIRVPNKVVPLDTDLLTEYRDASAEASTSEVRKSAAKVAILTALGDAEAGETDMGERVEFMPNKKGVRSLKVKELHHV